MTESRYSDIEHDVHADDSIIKAKVTKKWQSYIWDTLDKSPEERKFLFKLDAALLTFASLGMPMSYHVKLRLITLRARLLHQVSRPVKYQQRICVWHVCYHRLALIYLPPFAKPTSGKKISAYTAMNSTTCKLHGQSAMSLARFQAILF